jgi:hypothetical protein
MKNIHILPTNQPSRLAIQLDCKPKYNLQLSKIESDWTHNWEKQHIYIISSEEIEEGVNQWYLDKFLNKPMNSGGAQYGEKQNIIILTTDPTLIADGVQAIDNEFLEWFVKNPTCECVEVKRDFADEGIKGITYYGKYFVIIPQEEPKQYPMGSFAPGNYWHKECVTCKKEFMGDKRAVQCESCAIKMTQEEPKQDLEKEMFELEQELDIPSSMRWHNSKPKQFTLEETADKANGYKLYAKDTKAPIFNEGFIAGAKWQAEQNENVFRSFIRTHHLTALWDKWFEQFKKK